MTSCQIFAKEDTPNVCALRYVIGRIGSLTNVTISIGVKKVVLCVNILDPVTENSLYTIAILITLFNVCTVLLN